MLPEIAVAEAGGQKRLIILPWTQGKIDVATLMIGYRDRWISPLLQAFREVTTKGMTPAYRGRNPERGAEIKNPAKRGMKIGKDGK